MGGQYRAVLTAALLLTGLAALPASAVDQPEALPTGKPGTVTLITGDKVMVQGEHVAGVRMAPGREHIRYWQYQLNGHDYVVPDDATHPLMQDKLDKRLFDVTGLVQQDYDDAHEPNVPTIVTGAAAARATQGMTVVDTPKSEAAKVWRTQNQARAAAPQKIWLNGRVRANLDQSVPQIGAPTAWQAGFRGDGVKVAVLDTGYDANHPDLKSNVDKAVDFTPDGNASKDTVGHGTHVASTIAGSGAASNGRYKGVAPGAKLLVGKVLTEQGGREDWIIAGMQWAVQQGAKVVSMSLGGGPSDGQDLMSQTVNELSASSGALFVIAAGNFGAPSTIGSPGTADRALTVGSVTKSDQLSAFSSRGPRLGDYGLKPEITAPGSDIVAARAAGTFSGNSVNENYTRISGTSMATPHVAGAAAILAGQHPDWTGEQLKSALIGSAKRLPGIDTFAQGAGRVDVARGVTQQVRTDGLAAFGEIWGKQDVEKKITYTNDSSNPVTLKLDLDVRGKDGKPSNLFTVDRSVTVPAKSSATVTAAAHASARPEGEFSGSIRAQAGDVVLSTPLTANLRGDKHTLTVKVPSREGNPNLALVIAQNEETGVSDGIFTDTGSADLTVPSGRYRVLGRIQDPSYADTLFALPIPVDKNTELAVDTKQGKKVTVGLDDPEAKPEGGGGQAIVSDMDGLGPLPGASVVRGGGVPTDDFPLYTIGGPQLRGLTFSSTSYWAYPWAVTTVNGTGGFTFSYSYAPWDIDAPELTGRLVDVGEADTESIDKAGDVTGAIAIIVPKDWDNPLYPPGEQLRDGIALLKAKGAKAVLSYFNPTVDGPNVAPALPTILAFTPTDLQRAQALMRQRTVEVTVKTRPNSPVAYFLGDTVDGAVPAGHDSRFRKAALGRVERQLVDTMAKGTYRYQFATWSIGGITAGADVETKWPQRRTDYISPGASFLLGGAAGFTDQGDFGGETALPVTLKPGEQRTARMFGAPFGPELTTPPTSRQDGKPYPWAFRQGDRLNLAIPMFADSDPGDASQFDETNLGSTVLFKDGKEIGRRNDRPALGVFDLPRGPGRFQLVADANRPASASQAPALSTKTKAEWTFWAGAGANQRDALPLLDIRYDLPLDDHNTAQAGKSLTGKVTAVHQPGARASLVCELSVDVSYDEGATWQRAKVSGDRLEIPAGQGAFASLRATARDIEGNSVTETITRAYAQH